MTFIQIVELTTSRVDEADALMDEWMARTDGRRTASRSVLTADRDRPGTYVAIVEFPSFEEAEANAALPETTSFAEQLRRLCDEPPSYRNLDVRRVRE